MTPEEVAALQTHYAQQAQPSLAKDINDIVEIGRTHFGSATFDELSQVVADGLGDKTQGVMHLVSQFDRPVEIIAHLANNERQLQAIAKLSPARQAVELARIEAQIAPQRANVGADPLWKSPTVRSGRVSDQDWKANLGEGLSDSQWNWEFDRRQAEKRRR